MAAGMRRRRAAPLAIYLALFLVLSLPLCSLAQPDEVGSPSDGSATADPPDAAEGAAGDDDWKFKVRQAFKETSAAPPSQGGVAGDPALLQARGGGREREQEGSNGNAAVSSKTADDAPAVAAKGGAGGAASSISPSVATATPAAATSAQTASSAATGGEPAAAGLYALKLRRGDACVASPVSVKWNAPAGHSPKDRLVIVSMADDGRREEEVNALEIKAEGLAEGVLSFEARPDGKGVPGKKGGYMVRYVKAEDKSVAAMSRLFQV